MLAPKSNALPKGQKKEKFHLRVKHFLQAVWAELKKVHWPTKVQLIQYTGIVLATIFVLAVAIWLVDSLLTFLMGLII